MSGKKGRSGRLPRAVELARARGKDDALSCVRRRLPEILQVLADKAAAGDKECAIYCVDRVLGRPRIELDQRTKSDIDLTLDPSRILQAARESREIEAQWLERELSDPTRDKSHDPDVDTPFREGAVSQTEHCANLTDSVGIPPDSSEDQVDDAP